MLRKLQALLVLMAAVVAFPAAAQEPTSEDNAPEEPAADQERSSEGKAEAPPSPSGEGQPVEPAAGWQVYATGYFRAPLAIGISPRRSPDNPQGPAKMQLSYGPNRTIDANYYSFAYTRLQEQDWSEVFVHAKTKHIHAVVGAMGYWFQAAGFRNNDAAWTPGVAYLTFDTDFALAGLQPNVALTAGAWWPKFGAFPKYDTYTLGQFRHLGEQLRLTIPVNPDVTLSLVQGFGSARDGSSNILAPPPYQATVGLILLHYEHVELTLGKYVDVALHYNSEWTRDANLYQSTVVGRSYTNASEASLTTLGAEATLRAPVVGSLWLSPSYIRVKNGWALGEAGTEVMHSLSGEGLATNYLAWSGSLTDSTGSGSMINLGFLYENTLSGILGKPRGGVSPEVTLNVFGLFTDISLDLPEGSVITQDRMGQLKYGADVNVQALDWLSLMLRWDEVNYNMGNHPGYAFAAITPRVTFSTHFFGGESIYLQYSRYTYGDQMTLSGRWPWGTPLVAGSDIVQGGTYAGHKPDMDVVKLQATVAF
ncbi:MAG: hypothetical protein ABI895_34875 [Deltaproteobacteria bacterium]